MEKGLQITVDFGEISGLKLNLKKTKAMWLGKWSGHKNKPLLLYIQFQISMFQRILYVTLKIGWKNKRTK